MWLSGAAGKQQGQRNNTQIFKQNKVLATRNTTDRHRYKMT